MWQYNELYHHGIKGQKWGVRRFQNEDGTLTEAGRKRKGLNADKKNRTLSKKQKRAIAIGSAVAGAALLAVGSYALYKNGKTSDAVENFVASAKLKIGFAGLDAISTAEKLSESGKYKMAQIKNAMSTAGEVAGRKASSAATKYGMIGRQFVSEKSKSIKEKGVEAVRNAANKYSDELVKSAGLAVTGVAAKKLYDLKNQTVSEGKDDAYTSALIRAGEKAVSSMQESVKNYSSSSNSTPSSARKGGYAGKEITKKIGSPTQEHYSPQDEARYQQIFKNPRVQGDVETRQTVKSLRREGYNVSQIEKYLDL